MELKTEVPLPSSADRITFATPVMFLGSCFASEVGYRMASGKLNVMTNPHGTLFNPFSVAGALDRFVSSYTYGENDIYLHQNRYMSLDHHTAFSSYEREVLVDRLNDVSRNASSFIREASFLFVTFGTSYIYTLRESGAIVANCHKLPSSLFTRRQAVWSEIAQRWKETLDRLAELNPGLRVWFTVSPVRHLGDGAHANQLSKAHLLLAVEELLVDDRLDGDVFAARDAAALAWATVSWISFGAWQHPAMKIPFTNVSTGRSFGWASRKNPSPLNVK